MGQLNRVLGSSLSRPDNSFNQATSGMLQEKAKSEEMHRLEQLTGGNGFPH
jgi:hypothetical protein